MQRPEDGAPVRVVVRLATVLRPHAGGAPSLDFDLPPPVTIGAVIDALAVAHPAVGRRVRDEAGTLRRHVNVFVGTDNARDLDDVDTVVPEGAEVTVLPAVSGGAAPTGPASSPAPSPAPVPREGRRDLVVYLLGTVTYVLAGMTFKPLLNWLVGPMWIVGAVWVAAAVPTRSKRRSR